MMIGPLIIRWNWKLWRMKVKAREKMRAVRMARWYGKPVRVDFRGARRLW